MERHSVCMLGCLNKANQSRNREKTDKPKHKSDTTQYNQYFDYYASLYAFNMSFVALYTNPL